MNFTKVFTSDWYGKLKLYDIIHLFNYDNEIFSCTFRNSNGDLEKKIVNIQDLLQG